MTIQRKSLARRREYTDAERHQLLTGMSVSVGSTRFGHLRRVGLDADAMREAWEALGEELLIEWRTSDRYAKDRERYGEPFVVRLLDGRERAVL